ncbi:transposase family protein [Rothia nasisuis]|uniref:transposase family protein n=1 Tax=Rothia nasisuis TaxID=2109647 RepID=UPI0034DEF97E
MICTLDGRLLAITEPLPGARHDAYAFRTHGLDQFLDSSTLADKGYVGLGLATPTKRKPGVKLTKEQKRNNRMFNRLRSVVERVIALVLHLAGSAHRLQASVGLVWAGVSSSSRVALFGCGVPLMNNPPN